MYHITTPQPAPPLLPHARHSAMGRVLVIEEGPRLRDALTSYLADHQWAAVGCGPGEVVRQLQCRELSLVTLNARLGSTDGLDVLRQIRSRSHVPVIMYTDGQSDDVSRIIGLELGADDFICGALNLHELMARARAVLRRQELGRLVVQPLRGGYRFAGWEVRHAARTLTSPVGQIVSLTKNEYALLTALLDSAGRPLSRLHLMRATRTHEDIYDRSIDVQVLRLRRKLGAASGGRQLIKTERGFGYCLDADVETLF